MCDGNLTSNYLQMSRAIYLYVVLYGETAPCSPPRMYYLSPSGKACNEIDIFHFYLEWNLIDHKSILLDVLVIKKHLEQMCVCFHIW